MNYLHAPFIDSESGDVMQSTGFQVATTIDQARHRIAAARLGGKSIGVVMTMGALHEGHLGLVRASVAECDFTAVTIFVNPTQFGPGEDLDHYPRQLTRDLDLLQSLPVDLVFAPEVAELYRPGHSTFVEPPAVASVLEGVCRPGHFRGVATIVLKLLLAIPADVAYFGQKDYQQYLVIRDMVADLDLPVRIRPIPIVRDTDGLALSSRNQYLNTELRQQALALSRSLELAEQLVDGGVRHSAQLTARMREVLLHAGIDRIDYVAIADPDTLVDLRTVESRAIALVAAFVGTTRLIDNKFLTVRG